MRRIWCTLAMVACTVVPAVASAQDQPGLPTNDFQNVLGILQGHQTPMPVAVQSNPEPALAPSPRAKCDGNSHPLAGIQGRVTREDTTSPQADQGWTCNLKVVSHHDTPGGFRVWRYTDHAGHVCAYYDTSIMGAINVVSLGGGPGQGVVVLDMSRPRHPVQTDLLTAPGMVSPHESVNFNRKRGLLAGEVGNVGTSVSILSVYDVTQDCLHPVLESNTPIGYYGHESGFSHDGNTFWATGLQGIEAIDVTNPQAPNVIWTGNEWAHGVNLSNDGNTMYDTDVVDGGLTILDVHEIQQRRPNPQAYEISRLIWKSASIPQNTFPMTIKGHRYLLEFDEFAIRFNPVTSGDDPGAARIINIDDPRHPRVVSNLRLQINMHDQHAAAQNDPNFLQTPALSYGAHYCHIPRETNPKIAACSFLNSGLRIFDIRHPRHPKETAYFVSPPGMAQGQRSDAAFSQPAFDIKRRQVYFTDATTGFWDVQLSKAAWPR